MQDRIVREPECQTITSLSRTTRWRKENKNPPQFPKRIKISDNASGWLLSRLNSWLKAVAEGRPYDEDADDAETDPELVSARVHDNHTDAERKPPAEDGALAREASAG